MSTDVAQSCTGLYKMYSSAVGPYAVGRKGWCEREAHLERSADVACGSNEEIFPVTFHKWSVPCCTKQFLILMEKQEEYKTWQGDSLSEKEQVQCFDA